MIRYVYQLEGRSEAVFAVDPDGDSSIELPSTPVPPWAELARHRCKICPLDPGARRSCPAALSLVPVVEAFGQCISYETIAVEVQSGPLRTAGVIPAHNAVRSLMGLLMSLSACPIMVKLRPMAHFHLPFGSRGHTAFRFLGMYLLAQHLRHMEGREADWKLDGLIALLEQIHEVNRRMSRRLLEAIGQDAAVNSLIILDSQAYAVQMDVERELADFRALFDMYF